MNISDFNIDHNAAIKSYVRVKRELKKHLKKLGAIEQSDYLEKLEASIKNLLKFSYLDGKPIDAKQVLSKKNWVGLRIPDKPSAAEFIIAALQIGDQKIHKKEETSVKIGLLTIPLGPAKFISQIYLNSILKRKPVDKKYEKEVLTEVCFTLCLIQGNLPSLPNIKKHVKPGYYSIHFKYGDTPNFYGRFFDFLVKHCHLSPKTSLEQLQKFCKSEFQDGNCRLYFDCSILQLMLALEFVFGKIHGQKITLKDLTSKEIIYCLHGNNKENPKYYSPSNTRLSNALSDAVYKENKKYDSEIGPEYKLLDIKNIDEWSEDIFSLLEQTESFIKKQNHEFLE